MIIPFEELKSEQNFVGSKAYVLASMAQKNMPVPRGLVISAEIPNESKWELILSWWKSNGTPPLAVRSSAYGEDSKEMSFAGQNLSFLNIRSEAELKKAVHACFASIDRESSKAYRKFFQNSSVEIPMNVVLQEMVKAKYSGVYFTQNPIAEEEGALLEYIEGFGEALVSGKVNPWRATQKENQSTGPLTPSALKQVFELGEKVAEALSEKIDMEWAIDENGKLFLLQARPITATRSTHQIKKIIQEEFKRVKTNTDAFTWWDGKTFCEWTGIPSQLSYDVWKKAFEPHASLDQALQELGYLGFSTAQFSPHSSILENLFGRPYVNMSQMLSLYFGPIPYVVDPTPKTRLKFQFEKLSLQGILRTPLSIWRMISVAWKLSTQRRSYIQKAKNELLQFKTKLHRPESESTYAHWTQEELLSHWQAEIQHFSQYQLKWPLVVSILIDATLQSLEAILSSVMGSEESKKTVRRWLGSGVQTVSFEMNQAFIEARVDPKKRSFFLSKYSHRGPGEMDLNHPRWAEMLETAFSHPTQQSILKHEALDIEKELSAWKTLKHDIIVEEWNLLKDLLELRELWKMEILKPYAHIRYMTLELAKRDKLGRDIFEADLDTLNKFFTGKISRAELQDKISDTKLKNQAYLSVSLPEVLKASELHKELFNKELSTSSLKGLSLSGGLSKGKVRIIKTPEELVKTDINEQSIVVAPATDPSWTPLLSQVRGIIVERGGILSHCAIVAREMNIPALNLNNATKILKDGDIITLDADKGSVKYELNL